MTRYVHQRTVERAWTSMTSEPRQYRLTPEMQILCSDSPLHGELIGWYDESVSLADFRDDVKYASALMRKLERLA